MLQSLDDNRDLREAWTTGEGIGILNRAGRCNMTLTFILFLTGRGDSADPKRAEYGLLIDNYQAALVYWPSRLTKADCIHRIAGTGTAWLARSASWPPLSSAFPSSAIRISTTFAS